MAEPLAIFGATASIVGIIDVLAKSINSIRGLRAQWNDADFTFLNLSSQLTALKAALTKIKEWMESGADEAHHQLIMDLDGSINCCKILATKIDSQMSQLQQNRDGALGKSSKIKLMLGTKNMDDIQKMVERQTTALTLLLTACNCKTTSEQKKLLERSKNRKTLRRVEKDSASLVVLRDANSLHSNLTDNLSKLSMLFDFDGELFASKVYERAFRSSLRVSFRFWRQDLQTESTEHPTTKNKAAAHRGREVKILILGPSEAAKSTLIRQIRIMHAAGFSNSERERWRITIFQNILTMFQFLLEYMAEEHIEFENDAEHWAELVMTDPDIRSAQALPHEFLIAFKGLLGDGGIQLAMLKSSANLIQDMSYFLPNLDRIFASEYLPTDQDILHSRVRTTGISEMVVDVDASTWRIFDVGGARSERKKWIHVFEGIDMLFFLVPLNGYSKHIVEDRTENQMKESLALFESAVNSAFFKSSRICLIFTKVDLLKENLSSGLNPVSNYFPEYEGDANDITTVQKFFANKFEARCRGSIKLNIHYIDATDSSQVERMEVDEACDVPGAGDVGHDAQYNPPDSSSQ